MDIETFHAARITVAAKKALAENAALNYEPTPQESAAEIRFSFAPRQRNVRPPEARSPARWLKLCREAGLRDVWLIPQTDLPEYIAPSQSMRKRPHIVTAFEDGTVSCWAAEVNGWDDDYFFTYSEFFVESGSYPRPPFPDNEREFRSVLTEIGKFAENLGEDLFAAIFEEALAILDEERTREDPVFSALPPRNFARLLAAMEADVFGGMGSWNDTPYTMACCRKREKQYGRLSSELAKQITLAQMYAINQWGF